MNLKTGLQHTTVLLEEAVDALVVAPNGRYVDGTFGRGGHTQLLLSRLDATGAVLGFDKDPRAIETGQQLAAEDSRFAIAHRSFAELESELASRQWLGELSGILLDLGVSSPQLDEAERGFSFNQDGPLDMRMDPTRGISAADWVNTAPEAALQQVFKDYGEERFARRMARAVVQRRETQPFTRTLDLADVLSQANPAWERGKHPATRAFQGLRIHINAELEDLAQGLEKAMEALAPGGRLVVISFHSLEDRIVKRFMRRMVKGEADNLPRGLPVILKPFEPRLKLLGKPVYPSAAEVAANPRARSAVMRIAEKL